MHVSPPPLPRLDLWKLGIDDEIAGEAADQLNLGSTIVSQLYVRAS